ncbi:MAG TPA: NTP transferase domain-containing protein [Candidatus Azoamicus sp. OHIO2]
MFRYIITILLAGGKSSRFDINKPFITINNIYLLDRLIYKLLDVGFFLLLLAGIIRIILI